MKYMYFIFGIMLLNLTGCADSVSFDVAKNMEPVGFLYGIWHGFIFGFAWVISLFSDSTAVYAIYNNGGWYDFGFLIGVCVLVSSNRSSNKNGEEND